VATRLGDLTYAGYARSMPITHLLATGEPLGDVQREAEAGLEFARQLRHGLVVDIITAQLRLIRTLRGLTPDFVSFNDAAFDEDAFEQHLAEEPGLKGRRLLVLDPQAAGALFRGCLHVRDRGGRERTTAALDVAGILRGGRV